MSPQIDPVSGIRSSTHIVNPTYKPLFEETINSSIRYFQIALRNTGYKLAYNNLGCAYFLRGDIELAQGIFKEALKLNPSYYEASNNLAVSYTIDSTTTPRAEDIFLNFPFLSLNKQN